jgi:hypothetical protein
VKAAGVVACSEVLAAQIRFESYLSSAPTGRPRNADLAGADVAKATASHCQLDFDSRRSSSEG